MPHRTYLLLMSCLAAVAFASPLLGQSLVDRKVHQIAVTPGDSGAANLYDVHVIWTVEIDGTSAGLNASTGLLLFKNASFEVPIAGDSTQIITDFTDGSCSLSPPGCGGG